jgi:hypothetical protein
LVRGCEDAVANLAAAGEAVEPAAIRGRAHDILAEVRPCSRSSQPVRRWLR